MSRHVTVYAAIAANVAIAITKFIAATIGDSSALFSEGLHSIVDSGDGLLLLLGLHLSKRPATSKHPYGHGHEVYFWSTVVAMSIFGMGGGVSIFEGIQHLRDPQPIASPLLGYIVLAAAFVFEGASWLVSMHGFREERGNRTVWEGIRHSKDPTTFVVVLEDSAALVGIAIAAIGITLAYWLHQPAFDAIASILIGVLLLGIGMVLGRETRSLLTGEAATGEVIDSVRRIACAQPGVVDVSSTRTMQLGPELVHVDLDVRVADPCTAVDIARRIEAAVTDKHPEIRRVPMRFPA